MQEMSNQAYINQLVYKWACREGRKLTIKIPEHRLPKFRSMLLRSYSVVNQKIQLDNTMLFEDTGSNEYMTYLEYVRDCGVPLVKRVATTTLRVEVVGGVSVAVLELSEPVDTTDMFGGDSGFLIIDNE